MKILAVDTSTRYLAIALADGERLMGVRVETGRRLSRLITVTIERVLKAAGCRADDVTHFGCGVGPGSFTGLRIGMSAIKGLAWATGRPVAGVSSLDVIASAVPEDARSIFAIVDARRGLIYCAQYSRKGGVLKRGRAPGLITPAELCRRAGSHALFLGDALGSYGADLSRHCASARLLGEDYWYPQPQYLASCVRAEIEAGNTQKAADIEPMYLYPKECQIRKA